VRSEMHTQFANIATPSEIVVTTTFSIELGAGGGSFHVCIPYSTLEPIRDLLYSSMQGDQAEPDKRWVTMLKKQVQMAEVDLVAQLAKTHLTIGDIMELRVGDVIPIDIDKFVEAKVDNVPVFECSYGTSNGQYALKIENTLSTENDELGKESKASLEQILVKAATEQKNAVNSN